MNEKSDIFLFRQSKIGYETLNTIDKETIDAALNQILSCVQPTMKVTIKPNFVRQSKLHSREWEHIITHGEVIRLVLENVVKHMKDQGEINIIDAPQEDSDFEKILENTGLIRIVNDIQKQTNIRINCFDVRLERKKTCNGIIVKRIDQLGDPKGYITVDLQQESCFIEKENKEYYGADYDIRKAREYHNELHNSYVIARSALDCDVFINMPKLKTHKIGGMTCCLKNIIGIIGEKNCIPHHTIGTPANSGDCYTNETTKRNLESKLKKFARNLLQKNNPILGYTVACCKWILSPFLGKTAEVIRSGHWYGNDTLWRAILDLNHIIVYADSNGQIQDKPQRKCIAIIDAIIAGEGNGPMMAEPKPCGVLAMASNYLFADTIMSRLMGFDYRKIPSILNGYELERCVLSEGKSPDTLIVDSNYKKWCGDLMDLLSKDFFHFRPAFGWDGHIELD